MMPPRSLTLTLLLTLTAPLPTAQAQPARAASAEQHVLEIRNGRMFLDGRALPPDHLPDGLDLTGLEMTYNWAGPVTPVLEIDGVVYVLQGERLKVLAETDRAGEPVYFPEQSALPAPPAPEQDQAPLMEAGEQAYLRQLSERDQALYDRIQREVALENETLQLAARIRNTSDPDERDRLVHLLRERLDDAFELKQAIRAAEIEQAEAQLDELRRLLHERAERKESIIERRIEELTGGE